MDDLINRFAGWRFLDEPLYRWFIFFLALGFMSWGWNGVISLMK